MDYTKAIEAIFAAFNLEPKEYINRYSCNCPVHDGDNETAFSIYKESGGWRCFTMGCHEKYGAGIFGLVQCLLEKKTGKAISFGEAHKFINDLMDGQFKLEFDSINKVFFLRDDKRPPSKATREQVRKRLVIPAEYYLGRGYTLDVLDKYDVGLCINRKSHFYNRCVVPIYDDNYEFVIGYTGRDVTNHSKIKWLHSEFERSKTLYNSWFAKKHIEKTNTCILVESPGNIWRLEEAGIHCGLALFGTEISFEQMRLLSQYGVLNLILIMDNGEAGKNATSRIVKKLKGLYNIIIPKIDYEDLGECPIQHVKEKIVPVLNDLLG